MQNLDDNQKQPAQAQNDWTDNLLVKDKTGKFHSLKENDLAQKPQEETTPIAEKHTEVSTAPIQDNFVPVEHKVTGHSDDKAVFAFHPEDQEQLEKIAQSMPIDDSKKYSIEKIVDKLVEKQELKFDNENKEKFIEVLYNFFRGRRKVPVVREILSTKIVSSKKKLSSQTVDNILSVVKGIKNRIDSEGGLVVRQSDMPSLPEQPVSKVDVAQMDPNPVANKESFSIPEEDKIKVIEDDFSDIEGNIEADKEIEKALSEIKIKDEKAPVKNLPEETKVEDEAKPVEIKKAPEIKIAPKQSKAKPAPSVAIPKEKDLESLPKVIRPGQGVAAKKQMVDVVAKAAPETQEPISPAPTEKAAEISKPEVKHVLSGPVQELQDMTLKNFKRLSDTADGRADKVLEKINLLEQDSYTKKAQGIEAWRRSETYKIYLALGAESMIENKKIEEIAKEKEAKGEDFLDADEFSAISDLNKKLRF
ncbi:hypothetical protein C0580_03325 [Candidatus Parcubacteria bacterium]|nr:MAG: hypothetical protein C0580_03325 [Candidatus Parcubacteria bacterium]